MKKRNICLILSLILTICITTSCGVTPNYDSNENVPSIVNRDPIEKNNMADDHNFNSEIESTYIFDYYDLLSKEWNGTSKCRTIGNYRFYYDNNKIYFINIDPDDNVGTNDGCQWGVYDISTKECHFLSNNEEPIFMNNRDLYVTIYASWYYDNAFYGLYECSSYEVNNNYKYYCLIKMNTDGDVINSVKFSENSPLNMGNVVEDKIIIERQNKGDFSSTVYDVYSSDLKFITIFAKPTKSLAHGLSEPAYVTEFFGYGDRIYAVSDNEIYMMDLSSKSWIDTDIIEKPSNGYGKYLLMPNDGCILDIETGEKIYEGKISQDYNYDYFGNTYFGKNYNIVIHDGRWYKIQYPNCKYSDEKYVDIDYNEYEPMGYESAFYNDHILQLNDKYYILLDNYGVFLRSYEYGESQEETIILFNN